MKKKFPKHIAIIMDGNGRWAKQQGKARVFGHEKGVYAVEAVVEETARLQIPYLTLYTFSIENWRRPKEEVAVLMDLLISTIRNQFEKFTKNNIRFHVIGKIETLPDKVQEKLEKLILETRDNTGTTLTLALSYSAREEIENAVKQITVKVKNSIISPEKIDQSVINEHLYTRNLPDVDLLIRTSGEQRISNFLLWQIAYAELYFMNVLWPDFRKEHLHDALESYKKRERRFGKTSEQL